MSEAAALEGKRVLIVEDEYFVADDLRRALTRAGVTIVGPIPDMARALDAAGGENIDAAMLDINLSGEMSFPVAERLNARGIPFVIATGYDEWSIPDRFAHVPRLGKPFSPRAAIACLCEMLTELEPENVRCDT